MKLYKIKELKEKLLYYIPANIIDIVIEILKNHDSKRSSKENSLYWLFCDYCSEIIPDIILKSLQLTSINKELIHAIFKAKHNIDSTAFDKLSEGEFNSYLKSCINWFSFFILKCDPDDLMIEFNNYRDSKKTYDTL